MCVQPTFAHESSKAGGGKEERKKNKLQEDDGMKRSPTKQNLSEELKTPIHCTLHKPRHEPVRAVWWGSSRATSHAVILVAGLVVICHFQVFSPPYTTRTTSRVEPSRATSQAKYLEVTDQQEPRYVARLVYGGAKYLKVKDQHEPDCAA